MINSCYKILLFSLLYLLGPEYAGAEIARPVVVNQYAGTIHSSNPQNHQTTVNKWKILKNKCSKRLLHFWKSPDRGLLIVGVVLLSIALFLFTVYGTGLLILLAIFSGEEFAAGFILLAILFFALAALCILGIVSNARKLHRLKYGETVIETPEEKFAPRPPSKDLKKQ